MLKKILVCLALSLSWKSGVALAAPLDASDVVALSPRIGPEVCPQGFFGWYLQQSEPYPELKLHRASFAPELFSELQHADFSKMPFNPYINSNEEAESFTLGRPLTNQEKGRVPILVTFLLKSKKTSQLTVVLEQFGNGFRFVDFEYGKNRLLPMLYRVHRP